MPVYICSLCRNRFVTDTSNSDVQHTCDDSTVFQNVDVLLFGNVTDTPDEGGLNVNTVNWNWGGIVNDHFGTTAGIENLSDEDGTTSTGARASTHRQKTRIVHKLNLRRKTAGISLEEL